MKPGSVNSYKSLSKLKVGNQNYKYYSLAEAEKNGLEGISKLPKSLKVLLENLLRYEDDISVNKKQIEAIKDWLKIKKSKTEIAYICFLFTETSSSYLKRFSKSTLRDFGNFEIPFKPFFSASEREKILYFLSLISILDNEL